MGSCVCCLSVLGDLAAGWGKPEALLWVLLALSQHWLLPGWLSTALSCDQPPQVRLHHCLQRALLPQSHALSAPRPAPYPRASPEKPAVGVAPAGSLPRTSSALKASCLPLGPACLSTPAGHLVHPRLSVT